MKTKVISLPKRKKGNREEDSDEEDKERLSVGRCREILQEEGQPLSDEQLLKIRNFLYHLAEIGWEQYQQQGRLIHLEQHKLQDDEKSHYLRTG